MPRPRWKTALALVLGFLVGAFFALNAGPLLGTLVLVGAVVNPLAPERGWGLWGRPLAHGLIVAAASILTVGIFARFLAGDNPASLFRPLLLLLPLAGIDDRLLTARPVASPA